MKPNPPLIDRAEIERIQNLEERDLDQLPFGAIRLDNNGIVLRYNQTEADLVGRKKENVVGRNFFTEVAPCTNVQEFAGAFREGVQKKSLHTVFPYIFDLPAGPLNVWVTLFYNDQNDSVWVFVNVAARDRPKRIERAEIERIQNLAEDELDQLPYGAIRLDNNGTVLRYNKTEADLVGLKKERVIGKNFFTEVAPCTNVREFAGAFREGVQKESLHTVFPYVFDLATGPLNVSVTLFYDKKSGAAWVLVNTGRAI